MDSHMTELEERLAQPDGDTLREGLQQRLADIAQRLHAQISNGVPRSQFADWESAANAVDAAREVLQVWITGEKNVGRNL